MTPRYISSQKRKPVFVPPTTNMSQSQSLESSIVEDCLSEIARKHPTIRFVKLHHAIAEMDVIAAPAILAYRNGDVFATIVEIFAQIPSGHDCDSATLEGVLAQYVFSWLFSLRLYP